mmetsp:Transcript_37538/g.83883  ORF Transcript_37538/g.83883 Transcript_37538/m.83883 type:complete len:1006 (-) Transcript_37538:143-3160(-)
MSNAKVLGPSSRSGSTSPSRTSTSSTSSQASTASAKSTPSLRAANEGASSPTAKSGRSSSPDKPQAKKDGKGDAKQKASGSAKQGKGKKDGKETEDYFTMIPCGTAYSKLSSLKECAQDPDALNDLLIQKLQVCQTVYDFRKDDRMSEKEGKRYTLLEILAYWPGEKDDKKKSLSNPKIKGDESGISGIADSAGTESEQLSGRGGPTSVIHAVVDLVKTNAFRVLMHRERTPMDLLDGDDDEPLLELTWPHLELIYDIFLKVLHGKDFDYPLAQAAGMDKAFVSKVIELIESDDPREREVLKNVITRIYSKLSNLRSSVRRSIQAFCQRAASMEDGETPQCGLSELLEVFGSRIVGSFQTPLRKEHRDVLTTVLLPLYKLDHLSFFHSQLKDVVRSFVKKEAGLAKSVALALLRYWPQCASSKQTIFLGELEDMIHAMPSAEFKSIASLVAKRLSTCVMCPHSEVAEKALNIWRHQPTVRATVSACRDEMPLIVSALYGNVTQAWAANVMSKTLEVLKNFMDADRELFDSCSSKHRKQADEAEKRDAIRQDRWRMLQAMFDKKEHKVSMEPERPAVIRTPRSSARPPLALNEEVQLKPDSSCAFALCWDWAMAPSKEEQLALQALVVNADGKIIDAVHNRNLTAFQSAVRLTPRAPAVNSCSSCCGSIWVSLDLLPVDVVMVVCMVTSTAGALLNTIASHVELDVDYNGNVVLGEVSSEVPAGAKMGCLTVLKRLDWSNWTLVPKCEWTRQASHFLDFPELSAKFVKEVLPLVPKKQRGMASFVAMAKGSVADCPVFQGTGATRRVFVGMGWDWYSTDESSAIDVDLVLFNAEGAHVSTISKDGSGNVTGCFHTGTGALSAGVFLELDALPEEVAAVFLVAHIRDPEITFGMVQQPHATIIDATGKELLRYVMPEDRKKAGKHNGLIMARLFWNEFHSRWSLQALGHYCTGDSWEKSKPDMTKLMTMPPSTLQTLLIEDEDSVTRGDHRSTTAASSNSQSVIMSL